jgi:hypothetical protein
VKLDKFLENYVVVGFMSAVTIYSLFFDDIRAAGFESKQDPIFWGFTCACMGFFLIEIFLSSIAKKDYFLSFFFWLDVISTISMIPDIGFVWYLMIGEGGNRQAKSATSVAKTSRAGRITRVIRVIRLIRLIRIVKLYKQAQLAQKKRDEALLNKE